MRFLQDARLAVRYFFRTLRAELGSSVVIVVTLAFAISSNTVIFGFINALLFKTQPGIERAEEVVDLGATRRGAGFDLLSFPNFFDYQKQNQVFTALAAYTEVPRSVSLRISGQAEHVWGVPVTGNLFEVLQAKPAAGRLFGPDDEQPGRELVAVISYGFWERRFGRDPSIVGAHVYVHARPVTIVGVAPKGLEGINFARTDIWTLLVSEIFHRQEQPFGRGNTFAFGIGRLKPGISIEQAQADMDVISARLEKEYPDDNRGLGVRLVPHNPFSVLDSTFYAFVGMLFAIALLVLLIACTNVAGVCMARSAARTREVAIRLAIGAPRRRVIAQFMMETAALFAIAGLLAGIGLLWLNEIVSRLQFLLPTPIVIDLAPDLRVGAFVIVLLVCAATAAGLVPALQATRVAPASAMKGEADAWTFSGSRLRNGFVVTQIAVSLLLLVTGALFVRSLSVTAALDPGLDPNNLEAISLNWFIAGYGENQPVEPFEKALLERVTSLPNVDSASIAVDVPMDGSGIGFNVVTIPGLQSNDRRQGVRNADWNLVSPGYFKTMKIPLLRGRDFTEHDRSGVAIINETMANRYWPGEDPIGKSFIDGEAKDGRPMQVIGIAKDTNTRYVGRPAEPMLYAPLGQYSWPQHYLMIRTIDGTSVAPAVRQIFLDLNPNLPIISVQSMSDLIGVGLLPQRIGAWVATIMGLLGVLLACLGVYGVTALSVTRRSREIGIRTALGARPADILHLAFREGMLLAFGGIAIGCALALALTRFIAGFLFGIGATDGASFVAASVLLAAVTLMACYIPARRAVRVDPTTALRSE